MLSLKRWMPGRVLGLLVAVGLTVSLGGCGDILGSEDPDVVEPGQAQGPGAIPVVRAGIIGNFQDMYDEYILYTGMLTDEYILAGTFPTRQQVDQRNMGADNATLNADMWEPIQSVLQQAKSADSTWTTNLGDPDWPDADLRASIPVARLYAGYTTLLMAEAYCNTIHKPQGPGVDEIAAADSAINWLQRAEAAVEALPAAEVTSALADIELAARVGQARAEAFKGNIGAAVDIVTGVTGGPAIPDDFVYVSEYSANSVGQENEIFQFTNDVNEALRWTVGDGTLASRDNEMYAYYNEWLGLGMIDPSSGLEAFDSSIPVRLQLAHNARPVNATLASGWEARMYEIEADLRSGAIGAADAAANPLLDDFSVNPMAITNQFLNLGFPPSGGDFTDAAFPGGSGGGLLSLADAQELGRVRAAGLWQSGTRLGYWRRLDRRELPSGNVGDPNLWHSRPSGSDDTCFPVTQQEIDNNPNFP